MASDDAKRGLAPWKPPRNAGGEDGLHLVNSLTRKKEVFVPQNGNQVNWYICGPTVYDCSHMGHARTYVTFDILRRILQSYFGYNVQYVMNVTDIDDKIIKRARQRHLIDEYMKQSLSVKDAITHVKDALIPFEKKLLEETNEDKKKMFHTMVQRVDKSVAELEALLGSGCGDSNRLDKAKEDILADAKDILADWLDSTKGSSITDVDIFMKLARHFENEFHEDMERLGVLPANVLTRVSEYVPEIITFIQKIIDNGFAYEAHGSVYFNTVAFDSKPEHHYAKLVPEAFGDQNALKEGEGELSISADRLQEKRNTSDFALWKASKGGEPFWDSPWGKGRPGWHIECSVMASSICGTTLDIHSGGFDLKFPHHDNEIAQSEAHFGHNQWAHYWLHAGTLRIAGLKMAKSLKNFITIRAALDQYSSRQLRILFLHYKWNDVLDYSASTMDLALGFEKNLNEFFLTVKHYLRKFSGQKAADKGFQKFLQSELTLNDQFLTKRAEIHEALCDSMDTKATVASMREILTAANTYLKEKDSQKATPNVLLLKNIAEYLTHLLRIFGVISDGLESEIGFPADAAASATADGQSKTNEEEILKFINVAVDFRERIRLLALKDPKANGDILSECDVLRNEILPGMGVRLEDKQGQTMVKLVDPEELKREMEQKKLQEEKKRLEKEKKAAEKADKDKKARIPPNELFLSETEKYSKFDEKGIPTFDAEGKELTKNQRKKLEKFHQAHSKKYSAIMAETSQNGS